MYKIVAINLGSTSTKFAYYEDDQCIYKTNIDHKAEEIKKYPAIWDQYQFRMDDIMAVMNEQEIDPAALSAVVTRGGHTIPLVGGTYKINQTMLDMSASEKYGTHACDLGLKIANALSERYGSLPLTVDPPTTDEFEPLARYSGLTEFNRRSSFHALNHRAVAKQYAKDAGKRYTELNLIGVHMGGGITVACHKKGRMIDATNGLVGDGPFSTNRTGTIPAGSLVDLCYSGQYTHAQLRRKLNGNGGLMAYLGESDARKIEERVQNGDAYAAEVLEAMCYQVGKEVAAMSSVLLGRVDAIYLTGGIANSKLITGWIKKRVDYLAPVVLYPGEFEMQALALGAYDCLRGAEPIQELSCEDNKEVQVRGN